MSDFTSKCNNFDFGWGFASVPAWGAFSAPPYPLAGGRGRAAPPEKNHPALRLSDLDTSCPGYNDLRVLE